MARNTVSDDKLLSINDVARVLNVSAVTVKRYIADGKIDSVKIGGNRRVAPASLEQFIANGDKQATPKKNPKGTQFYWSQKSADVAQAIYRDNCKPGDIVMDPFLGAGSSLYGTRGLNLRFIGVELNEQPLAITRFNSKPTTPQLIRQLQTKLDRLTEKFGAIYALQNATHEQLVLDRVIYDLGRNKQPVISKLYCTDKSGKRVDVTKDKVAMQHYLQAYQTSLKHVQKLPAVHLVKNTRIAVKDKMVLSDIFSPINYVILHGIKKEIANDPDCKFLLGSVLHLTKLTDIRSQSQFPYWVPSKNILDRNIFTALQKKLDQLAKNPVTESITQYDTYKQLARAKSGCLLIQKPAQRLSKTDVPDSSVDFVLTDPPYFDQVAYSEYLKIWEYFLGYKSNLKDEIVVSQRTAEPKTEAAYLDDLEQSFKRIHRTLKPGAQTWVYFRESRPDKISLFLTIMQRLNYQFLGIEHVGANKYTYKQNNTSETTFTGDALYKFIKPLAVKPAPVQAKAGPKRNVTDVIKEYVLTYAMAHKEFSLGQLIHEGLVEHLYKYGLLDVLKNQRPVVAALKEVCVYDDKRRLYSLRMDGILNTLLCGDALTTLKSLPTDSVDACITDPPYSISGYDHKKQIGWLKSNKYWSEDKKFQKINAEWDKFTDDDYELFTQEWIAEIQRVVKPNGNIAIFGSYHNIYKIGHVLDHQKFRIINSLTWYKRNAFPNITQRMFCESTEHIIWAVNNDKKHAKNWTFNYQLMKQLNGGKQMRNMFDIPMTPASEKKHGKHPSQKPEKLLDLLVTALTKEGDVVIDPFLGSGTTAVSCIRHGRGFIGIDNNQEYLDIAKKRIAALDNLPGTRQQDFGFA